MRRGEEEYAVKGGHDVDKDWVKRVRAANKDVRIVPRVAIDPETWHSAAFSTVWAQEGEPTYLLSSCVPLLPFEDLLRLHSWL